MENLWKIDVLPQCEVLETKTILRSLPSAHAALAELKGIASAMPNQNILINTLSMQEAKDSSAIENIITTHDELYKTGLNLVSFRSLEAKEVQNYVSALRKGFDLVSSKKLLTNNVIREIQMELEKNNAGFRTLPGTSLKNAVTGEVIYTPPQDIETISSLMSELEKMINDPAQCDVDPLIKLAVIHFQFESIHPFYDGNGRTGRIINILYLILEGLLHLPILYLSNYIIRYKPDYYRLLQQIREKNEWEEWILFIIRGIEQTSRETIELIVQIRDLMMEFKHRLRANYKFYSQDLLNNLFKHPYTKIDFLAKDLKISRITAANYLNTLAHDGLLKKEKMGTGNYYINEKLFHLLARR